MQKLLVSDSLAIRVKYLMTCRGVSRSGSNLSSCNATNLDYGPESLAFMSLRGK